MRAFEPDKTALLRGLALLLVAGWVISALDRAPAPGAPRPLARLLRTPAGAAAAALGAITLVATALSPAPAVAFWGSYHRLQGSYTLLAYLVFFAAVASRLGRPDQTRRLVDSTVLASIPAMLYGVAQRLGLDPITYQRGEYAGTERVTSTLGSPVFLAGYAIMVWPLVLARVLEAWAALRAGRRSAADVARLLLWVSAASAQLAAVAFTESRGPFLGLAAGTALFLLLAGARRRRRGLVLATAGGAVAVAGLLLAVVMAGAPREAVPVVPTVARFGEMLEPATSGSYRADLWRLASQLLGAAPPLADPEGRPDPLHALRLVIGYGPESVPIVLGRLYGAARLDPSADRFHNYWLDLLVTVGVAGTLAALALVTALTLQGLRRLGLVDTRAARAAFWGSWVGGGLGAGVGLARRLAPRVLEPGLGLGLIAGLAAYLTWRGVAPGPEPGARVGPDEAHPGATLVPAALLAALAAHAVDIAFSFPVTATSLLHWVYAGLLLAPPGAAAAAATPPVAAMSPARGTPSRRPGRPGRRRRAAEPVSPAGHETWREPAIAGVVLALIGVSLAVALVAPAVPDAVRALGAPLAVVAASPERGIPFALVTLAGWALAATGLGQRDPDAGRRPGRGTALALGLSGVTTLAFGAWLAHHLAATARLTTSTPAAAVLLAERHTAVITGYAVAILGLVLALAALVAAPGRAPARAPRRAAALAAPLLLAGALVGAWVTDVRAVQADVAASRGLAFAQRRHPEAAARVYERALALAPQADVYRQLLARAYLDQVDTATDATGRDRLLRAAEQALAGIAVPSPFQDAQLALVYTRWAAASPPGAEQEERARRADHRYARAAVVFADAARLWYNWAYLDITFLARPDEAARKAGRALELDPRLEAAWLLLGNYHGQRGRALPVGETRRAALSAAAESYERALAVGGPRYPALAALGRVYVDLHEHARAIETYLEARRAAAPGDAWKVEESLARLHAVTRRKDAALRHARQALALAPLEARPALEALLAEIDAMP